MIKCIIIQAAKTVACEGCPEFDTCDMLPYVSYVDKNTFDLTIKKLDELDEIFYCLTTMTSGPVQINLLQIY